MSDFDLLLKFASGVEESPDKDAFADIRTALTHHEIRTATVEIVRTMFKAKRLKQIDTMRTYVDSKLCKLAENDEFSAGDLLKWSQQLIDEATGAQKQGWGNGGGNNQQQPTTVNINNVLTSDNGRSGTATPYDQLKAADFVRRLDSASLDAKLPKAIASLIPEPQEI